MYPTNVRIIEVGARDGLQNEKKLISVETKVKLIDMLSVTGLKTIEVGAFVSPKWVPQMADTDKVYAAINKNPNISYTALIPNKKGMEAAIASGFKEIAIFAAASESFSQKNTNCSIATSLNNFSYIMDKAKEEGIKVRAYVSCVIECPYEGKIAPEAVLKTAKSLYDMGCYEISLGDTIGAGDKENVHAMLEILKKEISIKALAVHFHDTNGKALENIKVALEHGITAIDSSIAGLGGCPYGGKGATGNVATEKLVEMLYSLDIDTGISLEEINKVKEFVLKEIL